jgi:hypothetical protein
MTMRTLGIIAGCLVLAFGAGWCTGTSGRTALSVQLNDTTIRADIAEVRAAVLDARIALSQANFGDARRSIERAQVIAGTLQTRLRESGQADRAGAVQNAATRLADAERLSRALDASAAEAAADALRILESSIPVVTQ